jgi:hypothetical protein
MGCENSVKPVEAPMEGEDQARQRPEDHAGRHQAPRPLLVIGSGDADGAASWVLVKEARRMYALFGTTCRIGP